MKVIFISLLFLASIGFGHSYFHDISGKYSEPKKLTILVQNETANPISISTAGSFSKLNNLQAIAYKKLDTVKLLINDFDFVYFSNKGSYADTILVSNNDTLRLVASGDQIQAKLISKNKAIESFLISDRQYEKRDSVVHSQKKIDSLANMFYSINHSMKPFVGHNDFQKFINYPIKVNNEAFKGKKNDFQLLIALLVKQYENRIEFYKKLTVPEKFVQLVKSKAQGVLFSKLEFLNNINPDEHTKLLMTSDLFINDDLIESSFGGQILNSFLMTHVIKSKPDYSKSKLYLNYKEAYDKSPDYLKGDMVKYARFLSIENMFSYNESSIEINKRYLDFKSTYRDTLLNSFLNQKYFIGNKNLTLTTDIKLIDKNRKVQSLNEIINRSKGKLIYIDFWASWCAPCRKAMPASRKLVKDYANKDVVFIYLSTDKDINLWLQALRAEDIDSYAYSYKILNTENAAFLKTIALKEIPRYVLLNKSGKMLHENAPGPDGNEITKLLNNYL